MNWKAQQNSEGEGNATGEHFRQELDKWFRKRGVLADLRSHLRHSMIMALQNNEIGPKLAEDTSPKAQAVNLLVAEFLFRRGCHYTLSVFASEVPTLTGFYKGATSGLFQKENHSSNIKKSKRTEFLESTDKKSGFQESEIEEIFNSLGLSSHTNDIGWIIKSYLQETNETSLLELFLQWLLQLSFKLNVRRDLESTNEFGETLLPSTWTSEVLDILMSEKLKPAQAVSIQKLISRVTEVEFKKIIKEERKKKAEILAEREIRIQSRLEKYESEIYLKLSEAEKEFLVRKESIEKELMKKHRHLSRLMLDWNAKHEDIVHYAKNFYNLRKENKMLRKAIEGLEKENKMIREQESCQNNKPWGFREEINQNRLEQSEIFTEARCPPEKNEIYQKKVSEALCEESVKAAANRSSKNCLEISEELKNREWYQNGTKNIENSDGDNSTSQSPDTTVSYFRKKFEDLEEKTVIFNQNYLKYKNKYATSFLSDAETDCELSNHSCNELAINGNSSPQKKEIGGYKTSKFSQTEREKRFFCETFNEIKETATERQPSFKCKNSSEKIYSTFSAIRPTKRQLRNREFFLKNRKILEQLEKENKTSNNSQSDTISKSEECENSKTGILDTGQEGDCPNGQPT